MAAPGTKSTLRGETALYIYHRTDLGYTDSDKVLTSEVTGLQGVNSLDGIIQATLNAYTSANFWTTGGRVLTYNPITDQYGIQQGEYVL